LHWLGDLSQRWSGTYGFNAGIEFDIDALERQLQAQQTQSIASNLIANNININTKPGLGTPKRKLLWD
jgi:hypothetical protein